LSKIIYTALSETILRRREKDAIISSPELTGSRIETTIPHRLTPHCQISSKFNGSCKNSAMNMFLDAENRHRYSTRYAFPDLLEQCTRINMEDLL